MTKSEIIRTLQEQAMVAVVRGDNLEQGKKIASACIAGKVRAIEVAYTNSYASECIRELQTEYYNRNDVCIGAGTVLDAPTAKRAIEVGAKYIVSPSFNKETALLCNRYGIPYIPGCMTIREIVEAMEMGSEMIKLFPGSVLGTSYIKAVKAPLPQVSIMVTGGVNVDNMQDWFAAGANAIGIGGEFNTLGMEGKFDQITSLAMKYYEAYQKGRK